MTQQDQGRCVHRGQIIGHTRCQLCHGRVFLALYDCSKLGQCTLATKVHNAACCNGCPHYTTETANTSRSPEKKETEGALSNSAASTKMSTQSTTTESTDDPSPLPLMADPVPDPAETGEHISEHTGSSLQVAEHPTASVLAPTEVTQAAPTLQEPQGSEGRGSVGPVHQPTRPSKLRWACGVTTVPERLGDLLPRTLTSLRMAGFDRPRLFVDGAAGRDNRWDGFGLEVTLRSPRVRTAGNWVLSLVELFIRSPACDRYAIFQDDMVICRNAKHYLDRLKFPERGYWNLIRQLDNEQHLDGKAVGFHDGAPWIPQREGMAEVKEQAGRGAVALVFSREGLVTLLSQRDFVARPMDANRGHRAIDGGIVTAMNGAGWREMVHTPSLVQHTGHTSTMGHHPHQPAKSFLGEDYDALALLNSTQS